MDAKLTLKLNEKIIEKAKFYAATKRLSLSRLVENYLQSLTSDRKSDDIEISPFVKSLSTGKKIPSNLDSKKDYTEFLLKKYR